MIHRPLTMSLTLALMILGAVLTLWKMIDIPLSITVCLLVKIIDGGLYFIFSFSFLFYFTFLSLLIFYF